ncbi:MAG: DUF1850 domain-containing protein [Treponema sp.]|nr:DUF1850 domain-containing protein [Treponema sp.]
MKKKYVVLLILVLLLIAGISFFIPAKTVLSVSSRKNPGQRFYSSAAYKDGFIISYTHSVNKGRIHDFYSCDKNENLIVLQSMHFVSYGAGIPEPEEVPGANFIAMDDYYIIANINRALPRLIMAVGLIADHSFTPIALDHNYENNFENIEGEIFLTDYFEPQTSLILEIKKVSLADYVLHKIDK